jgi:PhoH-like ATPase
MSRKIFVVDTSVMLYDMLAIHQFTGNDIALPLCILEELDKFKDRTGLLGQSARYVNRFLDEMRSAHKDEDGWRVSKDDIRYRFVTERLFSYIPSGLEQGRTDNHIIACALYLKEKHPDRIVLVITKDINLRVKCDAVGVIAEDYFKDHIEEDINKLQGWSSKVYEDSSQIDKFFEDGFLVEDSDIEENHFIVGKNKQQSFLGIHKAGKIRKLVQTMDGLIQVEPRNSEQTFAIEALLDPDIPLVTLTGLAGSGKTFLALMAGLHGLKGGNKASGKHTIIEALPEVLQSGYERLVITRTLQPVGRDLGYLPGTMEDKMQPWLMPILDNVRHAFKDLSYFKLMMEKGDIEVAPIPYIRGRTFNKSFVIVDEAQNATIHELKTIVTRIGYGSKIVLLGDIDQIDTPYIDRQSSGLSIVIDKFRRSPLAAHINLSKGQRSDLASTAGTIL